MPARSTIEETSGSDSEASDTHWTYPVSFENKPLDHELDEEWNHRSHLLVSADAGTIKEFVEGYKSDSVFKRHYAEALPQAEQLLTPSHFRMGKGGLLYFIDSDWKTRLCVPKSKVSYVLSWIHDSPFESAHAGPFRFLAKLQSYFYWPSMRKDAESFANTCDVCQKIKVDHRKQMGGLRPANIPSRPFETVSLDLITGLPPSGKDKFTAILVMVDKLTKFAIIVPTHDTLDQEGFATLFFEKIVCVYGLPHRII